MIQAQANATAEVNLILLGTTDDAEKKGRQFIDSLYFW